MRRNPHHGFRGDLVVNMFYNGLTLDAMKTVSQSLPRPRREIRPSEMLELYEQIATDSQRWEINRPKAQASKAGLYNVDSNTHLSGAIENLTQMVGTLMSGGVNATTEDPSGVVNVPECMAMEQVN